MNENRVKKNNKLLPFAKKLRKDMTPPERKLWYLFLRNYPIKIYKQRIIDSFIVDFYCAPARLIIEVDGSQHYSEQGACYDKERTASFLKYDLKVIRFSNRDIALNFKSVCESIDIEIKKRIGVINHDQL